MVSFDLKFSSEKCNIVCNSFGISNSHRNIFNLNNIELSSLDSTINNGITLITGHSGVGKSTLGKLLKEKYNFFDIKDIKISNCELPIIDIIGYDFKEAIYFLNIAGLSEPYLYLTPYNNLSSGQKFRFLIALILSNGIKNIYCDEFCSNLDRDTAYFLSYNLRRFSNKFKFNLILISNDENIKEYLFPDCHLSFDLYSNINLKLTPISQSNPFKKDITIEEATYHEYKLLEKYHYFPSAEEYINNSYNADYYKLVYKGNIVGVLVFRTPYSNDEENDSLLNINNKIKVLYRVIFHPIIRGCGILRLFLEYIYKIYPNKILYVESALAKFMPIFESIGWTCLDESKFQYTRGINLEGRNIDYLLHSLSNMIYNKYIDFCMIGNINPTMDINDIFTSLKDEFTEDDIDFIIECLELFEMKRFIYEIK